MKKALISAIAIALFALPMSLQANPPEQDDAKEKAPLSTMKTTPATPSDAPADAAKSGDQDKKSDSKDAGEKKEAAKK